MQVFCLRNRPGTLNGPHPVVIVPHKENGGAVQSIGRGQIRGLCNHFSLLTRQGGYGIVDNQSEVPSRRGDGRQKYIDKTRERNVNRWETFKKVWTYFVIAGVACLSAMNYELFIFPNQFAPSGINGVCTMIQYLTGVSVGYLSLLVNIPLAIWCYLEVSRAVAVRSMVYVVTFSLALLVLDRIDLSVIAYATDSGTSRILGPLVAGIIMGFCYGVLIKASAYTGGTDFVSAVVHKHHPGKSVFALSFAINAMVAVASFFVYDYKMEPVILCILYSFTSSTVGERFQKSGRSAMRFEIVTDYPDEICGDIIHLLHHSATRYKAVGAYTGKETWIVMCVVNTTQAAALAAVIEKYPHTFAMMSQVGSVMGNFKKLSEKGTPVAHILDDGDGKTV